MTNDRVVTIFGSSRVSENEADYKSAFKLGKLLAEAEYTICNGGYGGIMEASAKGAKSTGGKTIGVLVETFSRIPNKYTDEVIIKKTLLNRLQKLVELGDAYIIFRGSTGTLVELAVVWEYMNKGIMNEKPIILYGDFWKPTVNIIKEEFIKEGLAGRTKYIYQAKTPEECINILKEKLK